MENLDIKAPITFSFLWKKMREVLHKKAGLFWAIVLLFAVPIAAVESYLNFYTYEEVSLQLGTLDIHSEQSITNLANAAVNGSFTAVDYAISVLASIFQIFFLVLTVLMAYDYFAGKREGQLNLQKLVKTALSFLFGVFLLNIFYSYGSQMIFSLVGITMQVLIEGAIKINLPYMTTLSVAVALPLGILIALVLNTFLAVYFYNTLISAGIGRTRMIFAMPYARVMLRGQYKKAFLRLLPWMAVTGACHLSFVLAGLYFAGGDAPLSFALFGMGSLLNSVLQGMMYIFLTAQFFMLEAGSPDILRINSGGREGGAGSGE